MATDPLWAFKVKHDVRGKIRRLLPVIDIVTAIPTAAAGAYFFALKRLGIQEMPLNRKALNQVGIWPIRRHYYEPYFDESMLREPLDQYRDLPGLELDTASAVRVLGMLAWCGDERLVGPLEDNPGLSYDPSNANFALPDASVLYAMVRTLKPRRVYEIGSGNSTLAVLQASARSRQEGHASRHLCIEPYEMPWLEKSAAQVVRSRIEDIDLSLFAELEDGDILFIDNSHMIRPQGDVLTVVQRILPRLKPGVVVHIHDLFTPRDYPSKWVVKERLLWNEQYLVEAFLTGNDEFEILLPVNQLWNDHQDVFAALRPGVMNGDWVDPTSFWIRRKPADRGDFASLVESKLR